MTELEALLPQAPLESLRLIHYPELDHTTSDHSFTVTTSAIGQSLLVFIAH